MISPRATSSTESGVLAAAWYTWLRSILNQASHVEANVAPNIVDVARRPGAMNVMYRTPWICSR
jgi:hypothetical protein